MNTLNEPVYEINKDSKFYASYLKKKDGQKQINEALTKVENYLEVEEGGFVYYSARKFGFYSDQKGFEKHRKSLTKNSDSNGVYCFKKNAKEYKEIKETLAVLDVVRNFVDPFASHEIFGMNNVAASQWVGDRLFFGAKNKDYSEESLNSAQTNKDYGSDVAKLVDYKEYLQIVVSYIE